MDEIRREIERAIKDCFSLEKIFVEISEVPEGVEGDYASNIAMKMAKEVKQSPRTIAETLAGKLEERGIKAEVAGPGFLNITLGNEVYKKVVREFCKDFSKKVARDEYKGKKVVTEFSDPNPFKVLHIGHFYTSVMGESISRLIELAGGEVHRVNFGGDVGLHVAKTIFILKNKNSLSFNIEDIAKAYIEGTKLYEEDEEARRRVTELNKKIYQISERGEGKYEGLSAEDKRLAELYWRGREVSYKYFVQFYERIGVKFEKFYPESSVVDLGREMVSKEFEQGVYEKSEGAIVFPGEKFGLHTRVFINKEGVPTYEAKDVGLIFTKDKDYQFDESVVITGNEQSEYMKVVLKSVEQYAPELVHKTKHITHGMVRLPGNQKMSSRKGNFVKAVDILDDVLEKTKNEVIALGAIKYAFLKYKIGGDIIFDAEESVSMTGNSGVYLLYSAVRAGKIISAASDVSVDKESREFEYNEWEKKLIKKFMEYPEVLGEAVENLAPHLVANFLFEIAQEFSRFYEHCRVVGDENETERLKLVKVFKEIMEHGLGLLGIVVPEEM